MFKSISFYEYERMEVSEEASLFVVQSNKG